MGVDSRFQWRSKMTTTKNPAAVALGKLGGKSKSAAKLKAAAKNARLGGWPKGRPRKVTEPQLPNSKNP